MTSKGLFQPLVLAGLLAAGFTLVWGIVGLWAVEVGQHVLGPALTTEGLNFCPDGTPLVGHDEHGSLPWRDLEGNPVPPPENGTAEMLGGTRLPAALPDRPDGEGTPWDQRICSFSDGGSPPVYWYFVCDGRPGGTGYFVGYDSNSRACVGYLGAAGFRTDPLPPEERIPFAGATFGERSRVLTTRSGYGHTEHPRERYRGRAPRGSVSTWDVYVFGLDGKVYHADLQKRTLHVALDEPGLRSVVLCAGLPDPVRGTPHRVAARTGDAVQVLNNDGRLLARYPIPEPLRGGDFTFAETTAGEALMFWDSGTDLLATRVDYRIYWMAPDGRYREGSVSLLPFWWRSELRKVHVLGGVVVPAPLVLGGLVETLRSRDLMEKGLAATYPEALGRALREFAPALVIAHLLAAVLAVLCYRRQVRYGVSGPERVIWPLFVLALGLPGWVGYRFGRSWPVLESCPACGTGVPRDRGECARCAAEFPRPSLKGTEVFA
jgi:hypothetical protein